MEKSSTRVKASIDGLLFPPGTRRPNSMKLYTVVGGAFGVNAVRRCRAIKFLALPPPSLRFQFNPLSYVVCTRREAKSIHESKDSSNVSFTCVHEL